MKGEISAYFHKIVEIVNLVLLRRRVIGFRESEGPNEFAALIPCKAFGKNLLGTISEEHHRQSNSARCASQGRLSMTEG